MPLTTRMYAAVTARTALDLASRVAATTRATAKPRENPTAVRIRLMSRPPGRFPGNPIKKFPRLRTTNSNCPTAIPSPMQPNVGQAKQPGQAGRKNQIAERSQRQ